jgi:hypothetical protein
VDELAYRRYIERANKAEELYKTIREMYGKEIPWKQAYLLAVKDRLLSFAEKNLVKEFYSLR